MGRRMELSRICDTYGYFHDGSGWVPPTWQVCLIFK